MTKTGQGPVGYILNLTFTLLVIAVVVSGLLGFVNYITADRIAEIAADKTRSSMQNVLPAENYDRLEYIGENDMVMGLYEAGDAGYVVEVTPTGFGGAIHMVVGVSTDGTVTGVEITKMSETSGLGANAAKESFRSQFVGASDMVAVTKDGGRIDALTGATVTSRAVTEGVNSALKAVSALLSQGG